MNSAALIAPLHFHYYNTSLKLGASGIAHHTLNACPLLDEQSPGENGSKCDNSAKASDKAGASGDRDSRGTGRGVGAGGEGGGVGCDELEVGAGDACLVGKVEDEAAVAKEGPANLLVDGRVRVDIAGSERIRGDLAVLASQVASLAKGRLRRVARWLLAALEGIDVGKCGRAVAAAGLRWQDVQVVCCFSCVLVPALSGRRVVRSR